jgi:hypothetical protein
MTAGTTIDAASDMGKLFTQFATDLLDRRPAGTVESKKKFIEFFAVPTRMASGEK